MDWMSSNFDQAMMGNVDYGEDFKPARKIYVIKKDGSREIFNVQKVVNAVGKSAYRALTKFTTFCTLKISLLPSFLIT